MAIRITNDAGSLPGLQTRRDAQNCSIISFGRCAFIFFFRSVWIANVQKGFSNVYARRKLMQAHGFPSICIVIYAWDATAVLRCLLAKSFRWKVARGCCGSNILEIEDWRCAGCSTGVFSTPRYICFPMEFSKWIDFSIAMT